MTNIKAMMERIAAKMSELAKQSRLVLICSHCREEWHGGHKCKKGTEKEAGRKT
jgi:hypothetical protein